MDPEEVIGELLFQGFQRFIDEVLPLRAGGQDILLIRLEKADLVDRDEFDPAPVA